MTATNHVLAGALIASYVHNPWVAIPVAVASHFAMDAMPHFDAPVNVDRDAKKFFLWLMPDFAMASSILVTLFLLQPSNVWLLLACGVAAASPDLMWLYYQILAKNKDRSKWPRLVKFHANVQKYTGPRYWPVELLWLLLGGGLLVSRLH